MEGKRASRNLIEQPHDIPYGSNNNSINFEITGIFDTTLNTSLKDKIMG